MLAEQKKHNDFKQQMRDKGKVVDDADTQILKEKLKRYETSLSLLDKDNQALKQHAKEKDQKIQ